MQHLQSVHKGAGVSYPDSFPHTEREESPDIRLTSVQECTPIHCTLICKNTSVRQTKLIIGGSLEPRHTNFFLKGHEIKQRGRARRRGQATLFELSCNKTRGRGRGRDEN